ncbi:nucleoid-associated protein, partial [Fusicatenibacter saccharivorans]
MQDFSSVNIKNMIIHNVGNKVKGESLDLSTEICDTNNKVTNQYLKQFFFSTFKFDITYRFVHETDIAMNEIYNYVKHIFDNSDQFYEQSVNIAKHLYEVSVHPNIKAGELCIVYLQNCIIDDNVTDAVGIYKSESKDYYLQVNSTENGYDIECQQGINPKKLDKGCLIFNSSDSNYKVCVVDKNVNDAMYWKKLFLMIEEEKNEYVNTSKTLKSC